MNILFSTRERLSFASGKAVHVLELTKNLAKIGNKVHLIALDEPNGEMGQNIFLYYPFPFVKKRFLALASSWIQRLHLRFLISKIIEKEDIDVIYERDNDLNLGCLIGQKRGIPTVLELNGIPPKDMEMYGYEKSLVEKRLKLEMEQFEKVDKIVAVSQGIKEYYVSRGLDEKKVVVINNGVNTDLFKPMDRNECRKELNTGSCSLICFVGVFKPWQGLEYLIEAMPSVIEHLPCAKLIIVGYFKEPKGFEFKPSIKDLIALAERLEIAENIVFTGRVPYHRIPLYINASDICVCPRINRGGSPLKIFEYMACSKSVITTPGFTDALRHLETAVIVEPKNSKAIAEAILLLLSDEDLRNKIAENAFRESKKHSWLNVSKEVLKVLEEEVKSQD